MESTLLEAPGVLGEARMVARRLCTLFAEGIDPARVVVTHRDLNTVAAVVREVFDEYGISYRWPIPAYLKSSRSIAFLLKAWHLSEEQFRFRSLSAVLRNGCYQPPNWDASLPLKSEALLRTLGVPRYREDYEATIAERIERPFPALEDQHADIRWQEKHRKQLEHCREFYTWFFARWDRRVEVATAKQHVNRFAEFATDFGVANANDVRQLFGELQAWAPSRSQRMPRSDFDSEVNRILNETEITSVVVTNTETSVTTITIVVPEAVAERDCDHLVVMGLGEGSFPRFDGNPDTTLETERTLWNSLVAAPKTTLSLSYPAVDARGQLLLPATFLIEYLDTHPVTRHKQRMLLENYAKDVAYSAAEIRFQFAANTLQGAPMLPASVVENLHAAKTMATARFHGGQHGVYDGKLANADLIRGIATRFTEKTFSPTSLERYVACPFRFWMQDVLHLEASDEPNEEVEATHTGTVIHRALSRYHEQPSQRKLAKEMELAVAEDVERTPSRVMKAIWQLERRRWQRSLDRYDGDWTGFREDCAKKLGPVPEPRMLEAHIGVKDYLGEVPYKPLTIAADGVTVKIGGVIDRVDVATLDDGLGYWVIDYKTGRGSNYTGTALQSFEKLQLPLYALAVEEILNADGNARPLGLAYWLISDGGPKFVLPNSLTKWFENPNLWPAFRDQLRTWVVTLATHLRRGDFRLAPRTKKSCLYCPYSGVCRINQMRHRHATPLPLPVTA